MEDLSGTARVILGMLRHSAKTGYEIKQLVDRSTRFFWAASYGQIYPELRRLEEEGLIRGYADPEDARRRKVYSLTEAGEHALHDWLASGDELVYELRDEGLLKLFFSSAMDRDELLAHLRAAREQHETVIERLHEVEPLAKAAGSPYAVLLNGLALHSSIAERYRAMEEAVAAGEEVTDAAARAVGMVS
jgi:PadR family transcriptional regulator AphA